MTTQNRNDSGWVVIYALGAIGFALLSAFGFFVVLGVAWSLSPLFGLSVIVGAALGLLLGLKFWLPNTSPQYYDAKALLEATKKG